MRLGLSAGAWLLASTTLMAADGEVPRAEMRQMAKELGRILPLALNDAQFEKRAVQDRVFAGLERLAKAARLVEVGLPKSGDDPIMQFVPTKLVAAFTSAQRDLKAKRFPQLKGRLLRTTAYCIGCHTRAAGGVASIEIDPDFGKGQFSSLDKAEFYAATRQFPKAIEQYEAVLNDPWFGRKYPHRWERAAKKMLAITVRVEQKPRLALELLAKIRDSQAAPESLKRDTEIWRGAVKSWLEEAPAAMDLEAVKRLYQKGDDRTLKTGSKDAGLIEFLRGSAATHDLLQNKDAADYGEILFFAGLTSERLAGFNLGTLHDIYYEACIRRQPHSELAKRCYDRFRAQLLASGITDFDALEYPDDVIERMDELNRLAR